MSEPTAAVLCEHLPLPILFIDSDRRVAFCNHAAGRALARERSAVAGEEVAEVFAGVPAIRQAVEAVFASGEPRRADWDVPATGRSAPWHYRVSVSPVNDGPAQAVLLVAEDVTGLHAAHEDRERLGRAKVLRDALNRIHVLIHSVLEFDEIMARVLVEAASAVGAESGAIYVAREQGWVARYVYGRMEPMRGRRMADQELADSLMALRERCTVMSNDVPSNPELDRGVLAEYRVNAVLDIGLFMGDEPVGDFGLYYHTPEKSFTDADREFLESAGVAVGLALQNADRFRRLQEAQEALRRSNAELEEFAYVASHDLKAPLRAIANLAEWIAEDAAGQLDEENRDRLRLLRERVVRMDGLIEGLLAYSRAGRIAGEGFERVALAPLLRELVDELSLPGGFRVELAEPLPALAADPIHLRQLFQNLLTNAAAHHDRPHAGSVRVEAVEEPGRWRLEVADDGPGIPEEQRERVFKMFASYAPPGGEYHAGIGLAVVRKLVQSYGGEVDVTDNPPRGARFRIWWPR